MYEYLYCKDRWWQIVCDRIHVRKNCDVTLRVGLTVCIIIQLQLFTVTLQTF